MWESHPDANIGIGTSGLVILDVDPRHEGFESLAKVIGKHGPLPSTPTSIQMAQWAETHGVELEFIQPGKPMQNGFIERLNRTHREEVLDMYVFNTIGEVREITEARLLDYNELRPHESLGNLTPHEFAAAALPHPPPEG